MSFQFPRLDEFLYLGGKTGGSLSIRKRYKALRRSLLVIMLLITLVPLAVAVGIGYFQYQDLIHREELNHLRWQAERSLHTLEVYLDSLKNALIVTSNSYTAEELANQERLDMIFSRLKNENRGLVDLSLISPDGIQVAYAGPYTLAGKDYSNSPWYNRTLARKVHVSEVFMGFRNLPHFVIAVSKKEPAGHGFWVVRASIDAETLDHFLGSVGADVLDDIFLVSEDGILQSSSRHYGRASTGFPLSSMPGKRGIDVTEESRGTKTVFRATGQVQNTPWILVIEQKSYAESRLWSTFRGQLFAVFFITAIVAGAVIVSVARSLADRIREADEVREALLKESEHTSKLASVGRLAAGVAHEINNPLAIINEKAGLMKDLLGMTPDMPHRDKFTKELSSLEDAVTRARIITHRLLGFARRMDVQLQLVQVNDVVREVIGFLDKEALYRGIQIEQDLDACLPLIESDTGQLQQIFLNIINNAIDAVDRDGRIHVVSRQTDRHTIRIDIEDNGPGIQSDILEKIFEPFFTTKRGNERHGTGLGLSITYGLVKKLGGNITVHSTVGVGTVFHVTLPLRMKEGQENGDG